MIPLFVPSLIDGKCLYLDADTLVLQDISQIFQTKLNGALIGATKGYSTYVSMHLASSPGILGLLFRLFNNKSLTSWKDQADRTNFTLEDYSTKFFSTGVILFDSMEIRKVDPLNKLTDLEISRKSWDFSPDGEHFNMFFKNQVHYIDLKWNVHKEYPRLVHGYFPSELKSELVSAIRNPGILHYANIYRKKPWKRPWYNTRNRYRIYSQICHELQNHTGINIVSMFEARL